MKNKPVECVNETGKLIGLLAVAHTPPNITALHTTSVVLPQGSRAAFANRVLASEATIDRTIDRAILLQFYFFLTS